VSFYFLQLNQRKTVKRGIVDIVQIQTGDRDLEKTVRGFSGWGVSVFMSVMMIIPLLDFEFHHAFRFQTKGVTQAGLELRI
jgi:hypothetical protein